MKLEDDERRVFDAFRRNNATGYRLMLSLLERVENDYYREAGKATGIEAIYRAQGKAAAIAQLSSAIKEIKT